jgi:hypothetical protein
LGVPELLGFCTWSPAPELEPELLFPAVDDFLPLLPPHAAATSARAAMPAPT